MAATGSILTALPFSQSKPVGLFIHELADTTNMPDNTPDMPTTIPDAQCTHLLRRFQPYRKTPSAMASTKNAVPSHEKGIPMMGPACFMNSGKSNPSSNDKTVPDTAPTAKNMATPFDHALARSRYSCLRVRNHFHSLKAINTGMVMPMHAKIM